MSGEAMPVITLIGFSEAGQAFAAGLRPAGAAVRAFDLRLVDGPDAMALRETARALDVAVAEDLAAAIDGAAITLSVVTASAATPVATAAAGLLAPGQIFVDLNSIGPAEKARGAAPVEAAGGRYVEGAIMSPVAPHGYKVPILVAGPAAADVAALLNPLGMNVEFAGETIGAASATKMCRSVVMKGIEALVVESLVTARRFGVDAKVLDSLAETYPGIDWPNRSAYLLGRVIKHGRRRAAEMREAADAVRSTGLEPLMAEATAARQEWVAGLDVAGADVDRGYQELADLLIAAWSDTKTAAR